MLSLILISMTMVSGEVILNGPCPDIKPVENFDLNAYMGTWYEYKKLPIVNEGKGKCGKVTYTLDGNDSFTAKNGHVLDGVEKYVVGVAKKTDDANNAAKFLLTVTVGKYTIRAPLLILYTDYTNTAISYSCRDVPKSNSHKLNIWVLTRSKMLEGEAKAAVDSFLSTNFSGVDPSAYILTDLSDDACKVTTSEIYTAPVRN